MEKPRFTSPQEAESAFYDALSRGDLEAMMAVWAEDEDVVCVPSSGTRHVGLAAVRDAWRECFAAGRRLQIQLTHQVAINSIVQAVHNLLQHVVAEGEPRFAEPLAVTNVYVRGASGWRIVMHHASALPEGEPAPLPGAQRTIH